MWTRGAVGTPPVFAGDEWLIFHALSTAEAFDEFQLWPPSSLRDTAHTPCLHCLDVSGYQVHWEKVSGRLVRVETGRVTGGLSFRDQPMLQAAWLADTARWVFVQGQARTDSALTGLRAIVRTIRIREKAVPSRIHHFLIEISSYWRRRVNCQVMFAR
jgi:hypothetical protein